MMGKKIDYFLVILFPFLAFVLSLAVNAGFLLSILLFFGLLSIYLSIRHRKAIIKTFIFSVLFSVPIAVMADYIATLNKVWHVPTIFSFRFLNIISIENFIWGFALTYSIVIFYEYFFDKTGKELISRRIRYFGYIFGALLALFFAVLLVRPAMLQIKHAYLWLGVTLVLIPEIIFLLVYPGLFLKFTKTGIYFFLFSTLHELSSLQLGHWWFPCSDCIGWVELVGQRLPFEEFFFFIMLGAIGILCYYEFFNDDRK